MSLPVGFLNYRGLDREEVVGHLVSDVLDKEYLRLRHRWVECFQGKVVKYEIRTPISRSARGTCLYLIFLLRVLTASIG